MMKIVVIFALFVVAAFAQQCLPADYANNVWGTPVVLSAPVSIQPGAFCNKNGDAPIQSCCDQTVLQQYADFWKTYRGNIDGAITNFKDAAKGADAQKLVYSNLPAGVDVSLLPPAYKDALNGVVNSYKEFLSNGPTNFGTCLKGLELYYQGILCGFCSPNWNDMVQVSQAGGVYNVNFDLSTSTCTKLGEQCLPFVKSIYPVIKSIVGLATAFQFPNTDFSGFFPCADDNCPQFACDTFVRGFSIPDGNVNFTDVVTAASGTTGRFINNAMLMTRNPNNGKNFFTRQSQNNVQQTNTYSQSGYDAYAAGNNGGFSGSASSGNGGSSSAFTVIPSIFAGLIALFFAL